MATITIRNLDDEVKARLRVRAARNGRSMEAEAREVLRDAVIEEQARDIQAEIDEMGFGTWLVQHFAPGYPEFEVPPRDKTPAPFVDFEDPTFDP